MEGPRILLVIGGGIAAYKACELVRLIRKGGGDVTCVLTEGGSQFVTPMALAALSENPVYTSLWDLKNEVEMGHIQLSRQADLIVVDRDPLAIRPAELPHVRVLGTMIEGIWVWQAPGAELGGPRQEP